MATLTRSHFHRVHNFSWLHGMGAYILRSLAKGTVRTTVTTQIRDRQKDLRAIGKYLTKIVISDLLCMRQKFRMAIANPLTGSVKIEPNIWRACRVQSQDTFWQETREPFLQERWNLKSVLWFPQISFNQEVGAQSGPTHIPKPQALFYQVEP